MTLERLALFARVKDLLIELRAIPKRAKNWAAISGFTNDEVNRAAYLESQSN